MRIVFMGTPEFAVPSLEMLINEGYEVVAVITQPDKPKGRGNKLTASPVKEYAMKSGIEVFQPEKVKTPDFINGLKNISPDLLVTAAYGKILPKDVLDIPLFGCINVHGSLLPKYRGAAPVHWAIINGEKMTGITTMFTDVGMDTGDMLLKSQIEITEDMTTGELHDRLSVLGAEVLKETLVKLKDSTLVRTPQPGDEATYAPIIHKDIGQIDWSKPSNEIHNLVRGTNPWPGAFTFYNGEKMRVWKTVLSRETSPCQTQTREPSPCLYPCLSHGIPRPGTICKVGREGVNIVSGAGSVTILEIQFDSCRKMSIEEYICGHQIVEGEVLG